MPRSISDAAIRLTGSTTAPANPAETKLSELSGQGVVELMCGINKADYSLGATGNSSIAEQEACKKGEGQAPGPAQYDGNLTPFWYLDENGAPVDLEMKVWDFLKVEGTTVHLWEREGPPSDQAWAVDDEYDYYEAILGVAKPPSDRFTGYVKRSVQLFIQNHVRGKVVAGA